MEERNIQVEGHRGFTQTLDASLVRRWEEMCRTWELDGVPKKAKNPYHTEGLSEFLVNALVIRWLTHVCSFDGGRYS